MNKKNVLMAFLSVVGVFSATLHGSGTITELYYKDYGHVNRTVIVTTEKPSYTIHDLTQEKQIVIKVDRAKKSTRLPARLAYDSNFLEFAVIDESEVGKAKVIIQVNRQFYMETFFLNGTRNRIVIDVFTKRTPETAEEKASFLDFYVTVGYNDKANNLIKDMTRANRDYTGVYYYWGKLLLIKQEIDSAAEKFKKVGFDQKEYLPAQLELMKLGLITYDFDNESEKIFLQYRDYFFQAKEINQQQFLTAWVSGLFSNREEAEQLMRNVDYKDKDIELMLANFTASMQNIGFGKHSKIPAITRALSFDTKSGKTRLFSPAAIVIILLLIIVFMLLMMKLKKRIRYLLLQSEIEDIESENKRSNDLSLEEDNTGEEEQLGELQSEESCEEPKDETTYPEEAKDYRIEDELNKLTRDLFREDDHPIEKEADGTDEKENGNLEEESSASIDKNKKFNLQEELNKLTRVISPDYTLPKQEQVTDSLYEEDTSEEPHEKNLIENEEDDKKADDISFEEEGEISTINSEKLRQELTLKLHNQGWSISAIAKELNASEAEIEWFLSKL